MTAFQTTALPRDGTLVGRERVREEVGRVGQQGRFI
jgi:hypothetical protein